MQNKFGMDKIQGSHKLEWLHVYVLFPVRIYFTSSKKVRDYRRLKALDAYLNKKIYFG